MESKHRRQMSQDEIRFAERTIHAINDWRLEGNDHLNERMEEKGVSKKDALLALRCGEIIRVQDNGRVVMRLMRPTQPFSSDRVGTCVCASLTDHTLVTAWYNEPTDNHDNLNISMYRWRVDVVEYLKTLRSIQ
jgi:hypothetical protein